MREKVRLASVSLTVLVATGAIYGCSGGGTSDVSPAAVVAGGTSSVSLGTTGTTGSSGIPGINAVVTGQDVRITIAAANSPLIGVPVITTCSNGVTIASTIGTNDNPGIGEVKLRSTVAGSEAACLPPLRIEASGPGKMRPIGAKSDGSEDVPYDPAVNLPLSTVIADGGPNFPMNPLTTLVANQVTSLGSENSTTIAAKKGQIARALGLSTADLEQDYRNANVAAASTMIVEVAALAAAASASGVSIASDSGGC